MGAPVRLHLHSFADYLAVEEVSRTKHEFLDGEIYAMAGGSVLHAALSASCLAALHAQLRGRSRVYSSDLRIRVLATGLATYPDASVVCGEVATDPESRDTVTNPTVLVEVLSPGTMDFDLGEKFEHYKQMPSLAAVLFVWQDRRRVEVRKRTEGAWSSLVAEAAGALAIDAIGLRIDVDALYDEAGA